MSQQPRQPKSRASGAMAGRTVFVVLIAVALGLLILYNGFGDGDGGGGSGDGSSAGTSTIPTTIAPSTTTTTVVDMAAVKTVVANASGVAGSAGRMTTALTNCGLTLLPATNADTTGQEATMVYNVPNVATPEQATVIATAVGVSYTGVLPTPSPVKAVGDAGVVVVLGKDKANSTPTCPSATPPATTAPGETTVAPPTSAGG
jgi:hypothetical protein